MARQSEETRKEKKRMYDKLYARDNRAAIRARLREYRQQPEVRERMRAASRRAYAKDPEKHKAAVKRWCVAHPEKRNSYTKAYRLKKLTDTQILERIERCEKRLIVLKQEKERRGLHG